MTDDCEIWLYGSRARGDADAFSDTDVLVVGAPDLDIDVAVAGLDLPHISVSFYSWEEMARMRQYGSLYLHHLAKEGQQLQRSASHPGRLSAMLQDLPAFTRAHHDLVGFTRALEESRESLAHGGWPDFECEVVATVARHAAILGAYCIGTPAFGREQPFEVVCASLGYSRSAFEQLVTPATGWRLHRPGLYTEPDRIEPWLDLVAQFLNDVGQVIDEYAAVLPAVA